MKKFDKLLIEVVNEFVTDYDYEGLFEELMPGASAGEIVLDMYNAGLITNDMMEKFVND